MLHNIITVKKHFNKTTREIAGRLFSSSCGGLQPSGPAKNIENPFGNFCGNLFEIFAEICLENFVEICLENFVEILLEIFSEIFKKIPEICLKYIRKFVQ